jgi:hypothetical protein
MTFTWGVFTLTIVNMWRLLSSRKIVQKNEIGMCTKAVTSTMSLVSFCAWFSMYTWESNHPSVGWDQAGKQFTFLINIVIAIDCLEFMSLMVLGSYLWWVSTIDASNYELDRTSWKIDRLDDIDLYADLARKSYLQDEDQQSDRS